LALSVCRQDFRRYYGISVLDKSMESSFNELKESEIGEKVSKDLIDFKKNFYSESMKRECENYRFHSSLYGMRSILIC